MKLKIKRKLFISFLVGVLFAVGLGISGMTKPQVIIGFLDIFGAWNPALLFVMMGAVGVHCITYRLIRKKRSTPMFEHEWKFAEKANITKSLVVGSVIFGIGWGIAGYCPGPALTSVASFSIEPIVFVATMLLGMWIYNFFEGKNIKS